MLCFGKKNPGQRRKVEGEELVAGQTYSERRWPNVREFNTVLCDLKQAGSAVLLTIVWKAYDKFRADELAQVDCSQEDEDLERTITQLLEPRMQEAMSGFEPFYVQHGPFEHESRKAAPAQPPQYDIAFILRNNRRVMWPLEAKVLRTDGSVAEYIKAIQRNFLTCRYSPFSSEAAMLGYLLEGNCVIAFANIAQKGRWKLAVHTHFPERDHRTSDHEREVPKEKPYPIRFRCHHMLLRIGVC
jgi:hypothetical protein